MTKIKTAAFLLALSNLFCFVGCGSGDGSLPDSTGSISNSSVQEKPEHLGLYAAEDGTLMKDGKPFYGVGVNYFGLINGNMKNHWDVSSSLRSLETLASYDVRVIRFNLAVYWGRDWKYVIDEEESYFNAVDAVVEKAEELNIGLIPCIFWGCVPDYYSEPLGTGYKTDKTKTMKFIESFTEKVVRRYADSSALYAWEYSNETLLSCDWMELSTLEGQVRPDGTPRDKNDLLSSEYYKTALALFSETVTRCDPYHRIIGSGDAEYRESAYNLAHGRGWQKDTQAEHEEMIDYINEDMTAISFHKYTSFGAKSIENPQKVAPYLGYYDDWSGFMRYFIAQGKRTKKAVYLGETGFDYRDAAERMSVENIRLMTKTILGAAVEEGMPLTLLWNYDERSKFVESDFSDHSKGGTEYSWNETWDKGKAILEEIRNANGALDEKYG